MDNVIRFDSETYQEKLIEQGYTPEQAMTIAEKYEKAQDCPKIIQPKLETLPQPQEVKVASPIPVAKSLSDHMNEMLAIEQEEAEQAGAIGYMARAMVQATMPHSRVEEHFFERRNGEFSIWMSALPNIGLPYGSVPRLLMSWMTTEAVRTKNRELFLGDSLSAFLRHLNLLRTGGSRGDITRLKNQTTRLLSCSVTCTYNNGKQFAIRNVAPVEKAVLWWDPVNPEQMSLWESSITLSLSFFEEIASSPVPFRMKTLEALRNSSMALDIYCWLTYRNFYARHPSRIPWEALQLQFGAGYPDTPQGKRNFKKKFLLALKKVCIVYPEARKLQVETDYLLYVPGLPDVAPLA